MPRAAKSSPKKQAAGKGASKSQSKSAKKAARAKGSAKTATPAKKNAAKKQPAKEPTKKTAAKKAAPAKEAAKKGTGKTLDKFLEGQRKSLLEERATYTRQAQSLRAEAERLADEMEPGDSMFDEEGGEGDPLAVEREADLVLSAQALQAVEEIDRALAKIEAGTYGTCERCGKAIPKERLKALPQAALCVQCKSGGLGRR